MTPSQQNILDFLRNKEPQTVCAIAQHFDAKASDMRQTLHDMAAAGDLVLIRGEKRKELFEPAHGGYSPNGGNAA